MRRRLNFLPLARKFPLPPVQLPLYRCLNELRNSRASTARDNYRYTNNTVIGSLIERHKNRPKLEESKEPYGDGTSLGEKFCYTLKIVGGHY